MSKPCNTCWARSLTDRESLLALLRAAMGLECFEAVRAITSTLLALELAGGEHSRILAEHLASLVELDRWEVATERYRSHWVPRGEPYPHPERLLYALQRLGEDELERHLLCQTVLAPSAPRWVVLSRERLIGPASFRSHLASWEDLRRERPRDEPVLVGATLSLLASPVLLRQEWADRLGLSALWRDLAEIDAYRELAGAFLVLLEPSPEDRIAEFERRSSDAHLDHPIVRRAARAYVAALRRTRRWDRLRALASESSDLLTLACPFVERELAAGMARLAQLPGRPADLGSWRAGWERLSSLPLALAELIEVLDHYLVLRRELDRLAEAEANAESLADLELQILRRAKAAAENALGGGPLPADVRLRLGERLPAAGLAVSLQTLQEINTFMEAMTHA